MSDVLRGAVPLPDDPEKRRKWRESLGAPKPVPRPTGPFAPPPPDPAVVEAAVKAVRRREKSPERIERARANAGEATKRRVAAEKAAAVEPPPAPAPPPPPPPPPLEAQPCEVCRVPVSPTYIALTGRARHGHHPQES